MSQAQAKSSSRGKSIYEKILAAQQGALVGPEGKQQLVPYYIKISRDKNTGALKQTKVVLSANSVRRVWGDGLSSDKKFVYLPQIRLAGRPEDISAFMVANGLGDYNRWMAFSIDNLNNPELTVTIAPWALNDQKQLVAGGSSQRYNLRQLYEAELQRSNVSKGGSRVDEHLGALNQLLDNFRLSGGSVEVKAPASGGRAPASGTRGGPILQRLQNAIAEGKGLNVTNIAPGGKGVVKNPVPKNAIRGSNNPQDLMYNVFVRAGTADAAARFALAQAELAAGMGAPAAAPAAAPVAAPALPPRPASGQGLRIQPLAPVAGQGARPASPLRIQPLAGSAMPGPLPAMPSFARPPSGAFAAPPVQSVAFPAVSQQAPAFPSVSGIPLPVPSQSALPGLGGGFSAPPQSLSISGLQGLGGAPPSAPRFQVPLPGMSQSVAPGALAYPPGVV